MQQTLDQWPLGQPAQIVALDMAQLNAGEARRLGEMGLMADVVVTPSHRGTALTRDPLALDVGRTRIVIRARVAAAIRVAPVAADMPESGAGQHP